MNVVLSVQENIAFVKVLSNINDSVAHEMKAVFQQVLADHLVSITYLDLSQVDITNSAGIGKILFFQKHMEEKNRQFIINQISEELRAMFESLNLHKVLKIE